ncbi:hypothetical protein NFI96_009936 [Prochilodus magdalenae]|nr:hypothetical protein NFI96_009936 [Prochilodus magdalenae]
MKALVILVLAYVLFSESFRLPQH